MPCSASACRHPASAQTDSPRAVRAAVTPHVSDDNPFSEAQFKTLKYRPDFPARFDSLRHSEMHGEDFFSWYNEEHHHVALGLMTPHDIHYGLAREKWNRRAEALAAKYAACPERFPHGVPTPPPLPVAAWINKPLSATAPAEPAHQRALPGPQAGGAVDQLAAPNAVAESALVRPTSLSNFKSRLSHPA